MLLKVNKLRLRYNQKNILNIQIYEKIKHVTFEEGKTGKIFNSTQRLTLM